MQEALDLVMVMLGSKDPHKGLGVDLDPNNDLTHTILPDDDVKVTHKGEEIDYMDYIDVMEEELQGTVRAKNLSNQVLVLLVVGEMEL